MPINIKLLGALKGLIGKGEHSIQLEECSIREIIREVSNISSAATPLDENALLVLLNGVEISAIDGLNTRVKDGDTVSLLPFAHGGAG